MKTLLSLLLALMTVPLARAANVSGSNSATIPISVTASAMSFDFAIDWSTDDYPQASAPGRLELLDSSDAVVARLVGSVYRTGGPSFSVSGPGNVTNVAFWMFRYTTDGSPADGSVQGTWNVTGLTPGNYVMRMWGYTTHSTILHATTVWTNSSILSYYPTAGINSAPTIAWTSTPASAGNNAGYTISARGHDDDGNLAQVNIWKNGQPFAFAGGGDGTNGDSVNSSTDSGPQTITYTAQAVDTTGQTSATITHTVTIDGPPPPAQYTLTTTAGAGGSVSAGGTFTAGTVAAVSATPDSAHEFAGWSGDAGGTALATSVVMDRNKTVTANFSLKVYALTTSATTGGGVTPGGSYPYGTSLTIAATPDATHRFVGWAGDASGNASSILLTLTAPLNIQAVFIDKTAQTIAFPSPGSQPASGSITLAGSASSGLPLTFVVLSGPATISGNQLQIIGPGAISVQARQAGDGVYLPAPNVTQTFNAVASAVLKYRTAGRTVFTGVATAGTVPFVLEKP